MPGASVHVETLAGRTFAVTVTGQGGQVVIADEPDAAGGDDLGPTPYELLLASLGACTAMTLRLYADRKQWPLDGVRIRLNHERVYQADCDDCATDGATPAGARIERITREIELLGPLDDAQRARIMEIAAKCPIHRTLQAAPRIVDVLVEESLAASGL
jgi:uncharacterized OsmC-like protein